MGRYSTVLSGLTTSTNFLSWSVPMARSLTSGRLIRGAADQLQPREQARA